jgi:hypothetical protein
MILALLWLTISLPFVVNNQQSSKQDSTPIAQSMPDNAEEETGNPLGNNTEEKAPSSTSLSEEYLHEMHIADYFLSVAAQSYKCENSSIYNAFHGEVQVPPPNIA